MSHLNYLDVPPKLGVPNHRDSCLITPFRQLGVSDFADRLRAYVYPSHSRLALVAAYPRTTLAFFS